MTRRKTAIEIANPDLQIEFSGLLAQARSQYLQGALSKTVQAISLPTIDAELNRLVPSRYLTDLAAHGLRGELVFATPCMLEANPRLLGYYRLLLGFSQKGFYSQTPGLGRFKALECEGRLSDESREALPALCAALVSAACKLVEGVGRARLTMALLDDLTLLTLGSQFRGGANVRIGARGTVRVYNIINQIVDSHVVNSTPEGMVLVNASKRTVLIEFAADPDIIIREEMSPGSYRNVIAIEVKAGTDVSNIHNRIGEAEKSHQKAKQQGYHECWTVVNVGRLDPAMASRESPSTNRFYNLSSLECGAGGEYKDFEDRILGLTGIPSSRRPRRPRRSR